MLEQVGNAITFYAHYIASKVGATGLTVTVDVWEIQADGTATEVVTGASATEIGDGLYRYILASGSVDETGEYVAVFKTSDSDVDQQHIPALWVIGRAGIENLDGAVSTVLARIGTFTGSGVNTILGFLKAALSKAATLPSDVGGTFTPVTDSLEAIRDILQSSSVTVTATVDGDQITVYRGTTWTINLTGLGDLSARSKLYFTVKRATGDPDDESILQVEVPAGMLYWLGATAASAANASIAIDDESAGDITITVKPAVTLYAQPLKDLTYDVKMLDTNGVVSELTRGARKFDIEADVTRAVS
ncbi:MAG: hypothetical protein KKA73_04905 [Chloroflexi bacterium]|nr:hypothetical protein [Chloroflexota bacterium]MBU1747006.1 hypothetical protein [Chloroflexota bacterium]